MKRVALVIVALVAYLVVVSLPTVWVLSWRNDSTGAPQINQVDSLREGLTVMGGIALYAGLPAAVAGAAAGAVLGLPLAFFLRHRERAGASAPHSAAIAIAAFAAVASALCAGGFMFFSATMYQVG